MKATTELTVTFVLTWEGHASEETVHHVASEWLFEMQEYRTQIAEAGDSRIRVLRVAFPSNPEELTY